MKWSDIICEIAIAPAQSMHWIARDEQRWMGSFSIGDRHIEVFFTNLGGFGASRWRVDFRKGNHQPTRGIVAETTSVLNGIVGAIREFLETIRPDRLQMSPTNASREKLYRAVIKRMMPQIDQTYRVTEVSYGTLFGEFVLDRHKDELADEQVIDR